MASAGSTSGAIALALAMTLAGACGGAPAPTGGELPPAYPTSSGVAVGAALPDLSFEGVSDAGAAGTIHLHDYFEPAATAPHVLVVRVEGGAWCGTCRWHAAHTRELVGSPPPSSSGSRLRVLDLVLGNRDNAPAQPADLPEWRALLDTPSVATAADPAFALHDLVPPGGTILPLVVLVDTRTMTVLDALPNPDPTALAHAIDAAIASQDHTPVPPPASEALVDGFFHRNEWDLVQGVTPPGAPPADATNAVADSSEAAHLGKALFFDAALSPSGNVSCASCHEPDRQLTDGLPQAHGEATGDRHTPRIALAAHSPWQFWDGRADSLWAQALGPLESAAEFGSSRLFVARRIAAAHAADYATAFPSHALPDFTALPPSGKPGDAAYDALPAASREAVTRVFVDAGKAIAAYERTFRIGPSALDAYVAGHHDALSMSQKQGLSMFVGAGCMQCHWGPRLTDDAFHATRMPTGRADGQPDLGRAGGIALLGASEFSAAGPWTDAPARSLDLRAAMPGAFKTPSLRGAGNGAPFGHGGASASLVDVMAIYGEGGLPEDDARTTGQREPWLERFDVTAQWSIAGFLATLTEQPIVP